MKCQQISGLIIQDTITYSQVQALIKQLPPKKLSLAYSLLADLVDKPQHEVSPELNFMLLPLSERRKIMARQAEQMISHYEQTTDERETWQAGDLHEY